MRRAMFGNKFIGRRTAHDVLALDEPAALEALECAGVGRLLRARQPRFDAVAHAPAFLDRSLLIAVGDREQELLLQRGECIVVLHGVSRVEPRDRFATRATMRSRAWVAWNAAQSSARAASTNRVSVSQSAVPSPPT